MVRGDRGGDSGRPGRWRPCGARASRSLAFGAGRSATSQKASRACCGIKRGPRARSRYSGGKAKGVEENGECERPPMRRIGARARERQRKFRRGLKSIHVSSCTSFRLRRPGCNLVERGLRRDHRQAHPARRLRERRRVGGRHPKRSARTLPPQTLRLDSDRRCHS